MAETIPFSGYDANGNPVTVDLGVDADALHVALPQNAFGMMSSGEIIGDDTATDTVINFAGGLAGVTVENINSLINNAAPADSTEALIYVAFNNSIFNDTGVAGLRHIIGPNQNKSFTFPGTPKPTQITISVKAVEVTAAYTAAEA